MQASDSSQFEQLTIFLELKRAIRKPPAALFALSYSEGEATSNILVQAAICYTFCG